MSGKWRVWFEGVFPDMRSYDVPGIGLDRWFGDDECGARAAFEAFEGHAILYQDILPPPLGRKIEAQK